MAQPDARFVVSLPFVSHDHFQEDRDTRGVPILIGLHRNDPAILECIYALEHEPKKRKGHLEHARATVEIVTDSSLFFLGRYAGAIVYRQAGEEEKPNCMLFVGARSIARAREGFEGSTILEPDIIALLKDHVVVRMFKRIDIGKYNGN